MKNQIDINDFNYVLERNGVPIASQPCPQDKETGKVNPHVSQFTILGKHDQKVSVFHVKPIYYEHVSSTDENLVFRPMYEVCEHYGNHKVVFKYEKMLQVHPRYVEWLKKRMKLINGQVLVTSPFSHTPSPFNFAIEMAHRAVTKPPMGLATTTVYPDPNPETTTVDGYLWRTGSVSFADTRDGVGNGANDNATILALQNDHGTSVIYTIYRSPCLFDTSSIPDTDTISSADIFFTPNTVDTLNAQSVTLDTCTPVSNTALVASDYNIANWGGVEQATSILYSALTVNVEASMALNVSGLASINKTGVTKFGFRCKEDLTGVAPVTIGASRVFPYSADNTGTTQDPKLVVTHTVGSTAYTQAMASTAQANAGIIKGLSNTLQATAQVNTGITKSITHALATIARATATLASTIVTPIVLAVTAQASTTITSMQLVAINLATTAQATITLSNVSNLMRTLAVTAQATGGLVNTGVIIFRTLAVTAGATIGIGKGLVLSRILATTARAVTTILADWGYIDKYPENNTTYTDKYPES